MIYIAKMPTERDESAEIQVDEYDWPTYVRTDSLGDHLQRIYVRIAELEAELRAVREGGK